ncbi:MAG: GreA/GreB family elongation factor [Verrucomicrobiae bacterium]|nr:GreA/GreB family elongation factor [Verrucomicrobiae bacterium]
MTQELQKLVDAGKLTKQAFEKLKAIQPGAYVTDKSWGFGQVNRYDFITNQVYIDFKSKSGHAMKFEYAAEKLTHLPDSHALVRHSTDAEGVKKLMAEDAAAYLTMVLNSFPQKQATAAQIEMLLVPACYKAEEWKKVWSKVKAGLKKNPLLSLPLGKTDPYVLHDSPVDTKSELLEKFIDAVGIKPQLTCAQALLKEIDLFSGEAEKFEPVFRGINETITKNAASNMVQCLELAMIRDDLKMALKLEGAEVHSIDTLVTRSENLGKVLKDLPTSRLLRVLQAIKAASPADWHNSLISRLNTFEGALLSESIGFLMSEGHRDSLARQLQKLVRDHSISSPLLLWLGKERPETFEELLNAKLLSSMIAALERDQFEKDGRVGGKLHDLLVDNKTLIGELIATSDLDEVRDVVRNLQSTPAFEDLNRRSLLARFVKSFPELEEMVSNANNRETPGRSAVLYVSWASLEKKKAELDEVINVKIPANVKEIEIAKSYGDLRENHEFKAAKEMQRLLSRQRAELEHMLDRAQGLSYEDADISQVNVGTVIEIEDLTNNEKITYTLVGAWDGEPEKNVISYQTPVGQALLGKKSGEEVDLPGGHNNLRKARVLNISKYR